TDGQNLAVEMGENHWSDEAAMIPAVVHDQAALAPLRGIITGELAQAPRAHVVEVNVAQLAVTFFVHVLTVLADPIGIANTRILGDGFDHDTARMLESGGIIDREFDFLAGPIGQALEIILAFDQCFAVDGDQPLARLYPQIRTCQRRGPVAHGKLAEINLLNLPKAGIGIIAQIGSEQTCADLLARPNIAAAVVGVTDIELTEHFTQAICQITARADAVGQAT